MRVLIVDDHPLMRLGISQFLANCDDFVVVGEAESAQAGLDLALSLSPDMVILDIRLKGQSTGIDLARELRQSLPGAKLVVLSNFSNEPYVRALMELGADGYLLKDSPPSELVEAMRMIARGQKVFASPIAARLVDGYLSAPADGRGRRMDRLTDRETSVLQMVADGLQNPEIAERLHVSEKAVQFYLTSIYSKLGARNRTDAVVIGAKTGLVVLEPDLSVGR